MCLKHVTKQCDLYCKQCDIPICTLCITSGEHEQHKKINIFDRKIETLESELKDLKQSIYPKHEKAASDIKTKKSDLRKTSKAMKSTIKEHGQLWHGVIDKIIEKFLSQIDVNESKQLVIFENEEREIKLRITEISQNILNLEKMLDSKDAQLVSEYITRLPEFSQLPDQRHVYLPHFTAKGIDTKDVIPLFGTLKCLYELRYNSDRLLNRYLES